ncbi:MAG: hypothetical protein ACT443_05780, partial [Gemmatimonadota bacterium]
MATIVSKPEGITQAFNREAVATLAESDVQWLGEHRLDAWQTYEEQPLPTRQLEEWRYTDVGMFKLDKIRTALPEKRYETALPEGATKMRYGTADVPNAARA